MVKASLQDLPDCRIPAESANWLMRDSDRYAAWIRGAFERNKRLRKQDRASALGITGSQVTMILQGRRAIKAYEIRIIADFLGEPWPDNESVTALESAKSQRRQIPVVGNVAAGVWLEADLSQSLTPTEQVAPMIPTDQELGDAAFCMRVVGNSLNKLAPSGAYVVCDGVPVAVEHLADGDLVILRQTITAANLLEVSARRVRRTDKAVELACESSDPAHAGTARLAPDPDPSRRFEILGRIVYLIVKP